MAGSRITISHLQKASFSRSRQHLELRINPVPTTRSTWFAKWSWLNRSQESPQMHLRVCWSEFRVACYHYCKFSAFALGPKNSILQVWQRHRPAFWSISSSAHMLCAQWLRVVHSKQIPVDLDQQSSTNLALNPLVTCQIEFISAKLNKHISCP